MEISVSDQGQGIPEGELHKLFTDFGQTSTCPTAGEKSTGLGLGIVKRMVEILWWAGMGGKQGRDRVKVHVYPHHRRASANKIAPAPHGLTVLVKLIEFESKTTPHVTPVAPTKSCLTQPGGPTRGTPVAPEASCTANPTDDCVRWRADVCCRPGWRSIREIPVRSSWNEAIMFFSPRHIDLVAKDIHRGRCAYLGP